MCPASQWGDGNNDGIWRVYWTELHFSGVVKRANMDRTTVETLATSPFLAGVAVDTFNNKVYWGEHDGARFVWANHDGSDAAELVGASSGLNKPIDITVDPLGGKVYYTDLSKVYYSELDGSNFVEFTATGFSFVQPLALAIDPVAGKIYVADAAVNGGSIISADLSNGDNISTIATGVGTVTSILPPLPTYSF